jgi:HK97 family phage major capsid protein
MSDPDVPYVASGSTTELDADAFIDTLYALAPAYRRNSVWMMNGSTLAAVRKLKTTGGGDYIWSPSIAPGQPETLLGRPVIESIDMDDIEANSFPVALGDFSQAYRIFDRISLSVLRDPFSVALNGQVRLHARRRVGGGVVVAQAIRKMKIANS